MESENTRSIEEVIDNRIHENGWIVVEKAGPDRPGGYEIVLNTKEIINAVIAEHYRRLPPGDEGLAKCFNDALSRNNNSWYRWEDINADYRPSWLLAVGALQAALRQRGWLEPEEAETLKRDHELTKRNVTFWCERSRESAEVVDAQNARIAELEAEIGRLADQLNEAINDNEDANAELAALRARAECTITPDDAEAIAREHRDVCYAINKWRNTPWEDLEETDQRHRIEAMRRVLERRVGKVEPTAQPTPKPPTEAEIRAAIDAKQEDFLMRFQRWEKTKATVVGAVMEEEPCSCCNAEPSSFKVEIVPHEVTWREVEEAVRAAQEQHPEGVGVEFDEAFGYWHTRVCVGQEDTPHEAIEDALTYLRELAQPKPDTITPEKLWAECGGTGPIPEWARYAAVAECERRNAKGGE